MVETRKALYGMSFLLPLMGEFREFLIGCVCVRVLMHARVCVLVLVCVCYTSFYNASSWVF